MLPKSNHGLVANAIELFVLAGFKVAPRFLIDRVLHCVFEIGGNSFRWASLI